MRLGSTAKAIDLVTNERVFKASETPKIVYYLCKGNGNVYDVIYQKIKSLWTCTCKNVRQIPCSHIKAAQLLREEENEDRRQNQEIYMEPTL